MQMIRFVRYMCFTTATLLSSFAIGVSAEASQPVPIATVTSCGSHRYVAEYRLVKVRCYRRVELHQPCGTRYSVWLPAYKWVRIPVYAYRGTHWDRPGDVIFDQEP